MEDEKCSVELSVFVDNEAEGLDKEDEDNGEKSQEKENWASAADFLVSLMGYSMGLADVWRLPYLVYRNGGGAFLIAYVFWMVVFGVPLYFLEIMLAQYSAKGPWSFWDMCPLFRGFGISFIILNLIVAAYTSIIRAWVLEYLVNSFTSVLPWSTCGNPWNTIGCVDLSVARGEIEFNSSYAANSSNFSNADLMLMNFSSSSNLNTTTSTDVNLASAAEEFWQYKILNRSNGIDNLGTVNGRYVLYLGITNLIVFLSLIKSVKSLAKMMYVTCLGPIILTVIIWFRSLALPGSTNGMLYFITPDFTRLLDIKLWIEAAFMTFFTLGPGWGSLIWMGSHNKFDAKCLRDSVLTVSCTFLYGILNGLVVFSVVGVMSFESGISIDKVITSGGFDLGFIAFPKAITYLPQPQIWAVIFFIVLLLPGFDLMSIIIEPILCIITEMFPAVVPKRRILFLLTITVVTFLMTIPLTTQAGVYIFQLVDWYVATWSLLVVAFIETVTFSWIYGGDRVSRDYFLIFGKQLPAVFRITSAFIIPLLLIILFVSSVISYAPPTYGNYIYPSFARLIGWLIALSFFLPAIVWGFKELVVTKGSRKMRLEKLICPNKKWGPSAKDMHKYFKDSENLRKYSLIGLIKFNLTGKGDILCYS